MLQIFATYKPLTRIYDDFMIYDEQEKQRQERQNQKARYQQREQHHQQKQIMQSQNMTKTSLYSGQPTAFKG